MKKQMKWLCYGKGRRRSADGSVDDGKDSELWEVSDGGVAALNFFVNRQKNYLHF